MRHPGRDARPLGAQPLPQVFEPAASKAADATAFDHVGTGKAVLTAAALHPLAAATHVDMWLLSSARSRLRLAHAPGCPSPDQALGAALHPLAAASQVQCGRPEPLPP